MPAGREQRYDFFLSSRASVAAVAREVAGILRERGHKVVVQDYENSAAASFGEAMHQAVKRSRSLVILYSQDYERSPYTRKELASFEAERAQSSEDLQIVFLRCEEVPLRGLLADSGCEDLVAIADPAERKRRIIAAVERSSQAAPPQRLLLGVPPRLVSFTGRASELDALDAILMRGRPAAVTQSLGRVSAHGLGGIGKTSLAAEYARRYRHLYAGVCWCSGATRSGLLSGLAALAATLGAATAEEAGLEKAARAALRHLDEHHAAWLLVYDNVASPDEIAGLVPSGDARLLITSRCSQWGQLAETVALDTLLLDQAVSLLEKRSGRTEPLGAKLLAEELGRLPLALDHAGAHCKRAQMPFFVYAANASKLIATAPRTTGYPRSIAATLDLAMAQAGARCPTAESLLAYLAACAPERIPMALVEGAIEDEAERRAALDALAELSLVRTDPFEDGTPGISMHRLVQAAARTRAQKTGLLSQAKERLVARLGSLYPQVELSLASAWPLCSKLTPHLVSLRSWGIDGASDECVSGWHDLSKRAACYLRNRGLNAEADALLRTS